MDRYKWANQLRADKGKNLRYRYLAANKYKVAVKYRRNIYRSWPFLELIPEANWLRDEAAGREFIPAFTVRLEINSIGPRALLPVPVVVNEQLPIPEYDPQ